MRNNSLVLLLSASFLTGSALACTMCPETEKPDLPWISTIRHWHWLSTISDWPWVSTLSAGPVWEREGRTQAFYLTSDIEKLYTANQSSNDLFNGEIFVGLKKRLSQILQGQLGLTLAATSAATLSGYIADDADPQFNNYTYSYKINHTHLAAKAKLLANKQYGLMPWVSGSIGVGFNNAHAFRNTPLIFEALPNPNFTPHIKTALSYTLGAGVQKSLTSHWQVGIGYEFADWGSSRLGRALGQTINSGLTLDHLYTKGVLCNLTYLA